MTTISSTPLRPPSNSTKTIISDNHPSPSPSLQDAMKAAVGHELEGYTWQFDAKRLAKVLSPKRRKSTLGPNEVDSLDAYSVKEISDKVLRAAVKTLEIPTFPETKKELEHYEPLGKLLNYCVKACHDALGNSKGEYYSGLNFVSWDRQTKDGCYGEHPLKPDVVGGIKLPDKEKITANGGLYWRPPRLHDHELLFPVEVKEGWYNLVRQAGTYARCLFMASPLREFALVLGYEHVEKEIRFLVFHHGGLTSSQSLNIGNKKGIRDLLRIFLAILSWNTVVDAGLPLWCNDSSMILPGNKAPQTVQVKKVLHDALALRGRCSRVALVSEVEESRVEESEKLKESKLIPAIPGSMNMCALRRSARIQSNGIAGKSDLHLPSSYVEYALTTSYPVKSRTRTPNSAFLFTVLPWY